MRSMTRLMVCFSLAAVYGGTVAAQEFYIYPTKGQSSKQQEKDKYECYQWARNQSGFDPMQPVQATRPPPTEKAPTTSAGRGLLRGALGGAIIGEIADNDAGKGAAIGAVAGGLFGGMRRRGQEQEQQQDRQQWEQQQAANYAQKRNAYNRAYTACLEAKNYTVK